MASRKGDFIVGVIGRLVFKEVNGLLLIRQRVPKATINQTELTRKAGKVFRMAGKFKATLKESLFCIVDPLSKNNLTGIILQILKNCKVLWACHHKSHDLHENFPLYTE